MFWEGTQDTVNHKYTHLQQELRSLSKVFRDDGGVKRFWVVVEEPALIAKHIVVQLFKVWSTWTLWMTQQDTVHVLLLVFIIRQRRLRRVPDNPTIDHRLSQSNGNFITAKKEKWLTIRTWPQSIRPTFLVKAWTRWRSAGRQFGAPVMTKHWGLKDTFKSFSQPLQNIRGLHTSRVLGLLSVHIQRHTQHLWPTKTHNTFNCCVGEPWQLSQIKIIVCLCRFTTFIL